MKKQEKLALVESALEDFYGDQQFASSLRESVLYSIHAGGKRIRPFLLLEVLEALHIAIKPAHAQVAAALEMIHTGSLIHDDLPAMDDDDYRRGRLKFWTWRVNTSICLWKNSRLFMLIRLENY